MSLGIFDPAIFDPSLFDNTTGAELSGVFGCIAEYNGEFQSERGKLSSSFIVLEDNEKYQQFSYVIKTSESITLWGDLLKSLIHPAGFGMFSETVIPIKVKTPDVIPKSSFNNQSSFVSATVTINSILRQYTTITKLTSNNAVGYNRYDTLRRLEPNIPPIKTIQQINLDAQDYTYTGDSDYNYTGTINQGYWVNITNADGINTFCDSTWGDIDFLGSLGSIEYKPRNFKIEDFYTVDELSNGISFANKPILIPDSDINCYQSAILPSPLVDFPLRTDLNLVTGVGSVAFSRSSSKYIFNHVNNLINIPNNAIELSGARPVVNRVNSSEGAFAVVLRASSSTGNTDVPAGIGCTTSTKLVEDTTATSSHWGNRSISVPMLGTYKIRQYYKAAGRLSINIYGGGSFPFPSGAAAVVDLITGAVTGTAAAHVTASLLGNGWVEVISTHVPTTTGSHSLYTELRSAGSSTYTGDGTSGILSTGVMAVNITPNSLTTVPEYVSVGVLSSPWHGAGADGVKYFSTYEDGAPIPEANLLGARLNPNSTINNLLYCRDFLTGGGAGKWISSSIGSNLVTNGTFDTDASGWITFNCSLTVSSGQCTFTASGDNPYMTRAMTTVVGKTYIVYCDLIADSITGTNLIKVGTVVGSGNIVGLGMSIGTNKFCFSATTTTTYISVSAGTGIAGQTMIIDNIACYESAIQISLNQTGIDNQSNSCSLLTANSSNATIYQTITAASSPGCSGFYVKRSVGSGNIYFTRNGGINWLDITNSINNSTFSLVKIENTSVLNPSIGFKISNIGDAIIVDAGLNHLGTYLANPILTTSSSVTVNADVLSIQTSGNINNAAGTMIATVDKTNTWNITGSIIGTTTKGLFANNNYIGQAVDGTNTISGVPKIPSGQLIIGMRWKTNSMGVFTLTQPIQTANNGTYDNDFNFGTTLYFLSGTPGTIKNIKIYNDYLEAKQLLIIN